MRGVLCAIMIVAVSATFATQAEARRKHHATRIDANGNMAEVISHKTGAKAYVSHQHVAAFQMYVDAIEAAGGKVLFMGGWRRGRCSTGHRHPCGAALDVCQLRRGVVDRRCGLPDRAALAQIAASVGLFEGGLWCRSDYGHAQVGVSAEACSTRTMTAKRRKHSNTDQSLNLLSNPLRDDSSLRSN